MLVALALMRLLSSLSSPDPALPASPQAVNDAAVLVAALGDEDEGVREAAATLLADAGSAGRGHAALLGAVLSDTCETWRVRSAAARSLGTLAGRDIPGARGILLRVAGGAGLDYRVRPDVMEALDSAPAVARAAGGGTDSVATLAVGLAASTWSLATYQGTVRCVATPGPSTTALRNTLAVPSK